MMPPQDLHPPNTQEVRDHHREVLPGLYFLVYGNHLLACLLVRQHIAMCPVRRMLVSAGGWDSINHFVSVRTLGSGAVVLAGLVVALFPGFRWAFSALSV